ncbi:MAG: hypothetical protein WCG85_05145 [Polyangia bacterium]
MIEYFVHTDLIVAEDNARLFERAGSDFMAAGGFKRLNEEFDQELVLGLKTPGPFSYTDTGYQNFQSARSVALDRRLPPKQQRVFGYVNLWRIPHLADMDLATIMNRCADDDLYRKIDSYVVREIQNFVVRVQWLGKARVPSNVAAIYRVIHQFKAADLSSYLAALGPLLPILEAKGWMALGQFQNVTGPLNTVVEFWATTDAKSEPGDLAAHFAAHNPKREEIFKGLCEKLQHMCVDPCGNLPQAELCETFQIAPYFRETPANQAL